ncbi:DUF1329 domain-containing protein [Oleomonas cavernae]|uniref:DUF1329 domain-containing protein n=1 Tax=Oleomonas cavernae TaxID=2320859 RepID=A0A418WU34_9PROT|nr:DUF1329 domain-containing protein [Oleomonas cavernae]RJF94774.1 DUF1329 domain-containing protein [Oleomonas cavernae]
MHVIKYDHGFSRRHFLGQAARGILAAGVLAPLWATIAARGTAAAAYPDELLSIDAYTKGKIATGHEITADNVDLVRDLLDPIRYVQIKEMGRRLKVVPATTEIMKLSPWEYLEATLRNKGQAQFDTTGNVVTREGKPWIGGNPFPEAKTALEVFAGLTLSWGRHDISNYAIKEYDLDPDGTVAYLYESLWVEMAPVGRVVLEPKPYLPGHEDKLRYQSIIFPWPNNVKGTAFLNIWPYDQTQFPELYGYLPGFKRIRRYPTNQRFEPLIPGSDLYLSDAWAAGDPFLTWGNYKIVARGPALAALSRNWMADQPNWERGVHGGAKGQSFWDTAVELVPEAVTIEAEPVMFPRAPISKKQVTFDLRTMLPIGMISFDRQGKAFRSFDGAFSLYDEGGKSVMDGAHPYWSWTHVHAHNIQTNRITRLQQVKKITGGYETVTNDPDSYDRFLTQSAMVRHGS